MESRAANWRSLPAAGRLGAAALFIRHRAFCQATASGSERGLSRAVSNKWWRALVIRRLHSQRPSGRQSLTAGRVAFRSYLLARCLFATSGRGRAASAGLVCPRAQAVRALYSLCSFAVATSADARRGAGWRWLSLLCVANVNLSFRLSRLLALSGVPVLPFYALSAAGRIFMYRTGGTRSFSGGYRTSFMPALAFARRRNASLQLLFIWPSGYIYLLRLF